MTRKVGRILSEDERSKLRALGWDETCSACHKPFGVKQKVEVVQSPDGGRRFTHIAGAHNCTRLLPQQRRLSNRRAREREVREQADRTARPNAAAYWDARLAYETGWLASHGAGYDIAAYEAAMDRWEAAYSGPPPEPESFGREAQSWNI